MRRTFLTFVLIAVFAAPLAAAPAAEARKGTATVYRLRLRAAPSASAEIVGHLAKGESVYVVNQSTFSSKVGDVMDSWYEVVTSSGVRGWAFGYYLNVK